MNMPVLSCVDVRKGFAGTVVLREFTLDVNEHEVVVLIGASGSGSPLCCVASTCSRPSTTAPSTSTVSTSPIRAPIPT